MNNSPHTKYGKAMDGQTNRLPPPKVYFEQKAPATKWSCRQNYNGGHIHRSSPSLLPKVEPRNPS